MGEEKVKTFSCGKKKKSSGGNIQQVSTANNVLIYFKVVDSRS